MSVFEGEMDFHSVYMVDFTDKSGPPERSPNPKDDDCLIVGLSRNELKPLDAPEEHPDVMCPLHREYYKKAVERFREEHPKLAERYMTKDLDPTPIINDVKDRKRTEYLNKYCSRDLPFMSINLNRRAKALQTLRLPDDVVIPDTSNLNSYRHPPADKYVEHPSIYNCKPKFDDSLRKELRRILRIRTGESTYSFVHGLLGQVVLETNPFGKPRKEPRYGKWKNRYIYTYRL